MKRLLRVIYNEALVKLGEKNNKVVVMNADLTHVTQTGIFKDKYLKRLYNMGVAEVNVVCAVAGFAHTGYVPFMSTFALFGADHAFEQIHNSVCYTNRNAKLGLSHSGLCVGEDGGSHQSIEDVVLMRELPHMTIFVPCDLMEIEKVVIAAAEVDRPAYIRVARPVCDDITAAHTPFIPGKANVVKEGDDICLIAYGLMVPRALEAAVELGKEGSSVAVVNMHTVKPIDRDIVLRMNESCKAIVTAEEHSVIGGLGSAVAEVLAGYNGAKLAVAGIEDKFGKSGKSDQLFKAYGLTVANVAAKAKELPKQLGRMTVEDQRNDHCRL